MEATFEELTAAVVRPVRIHYVKPAAQALASTRVP